MRCIRTLNPPIYGQRNPEKYKAHIQVALAIRKGTLIRQSCEDCGDPQTQAHHKDYAEPLNVQWLCRKHHRAKRVSP